MRTFKYFLFQATSSGQDAKQCWERSMLSFWQKSRKSGIGSSLRHTFFFFFPLGRDGEEMLMHEHPEPPNEQCWTAAEARPYQLKPLDATVIDGTGLPPPARATFPRATADHQRHYGAMKDLLQLTKLTTCIREWTTAPKPLMPNPPTRSFLPPAAMRSELPLPTAGRGFVANIL